MKKSFTLLELVTSIFIIMLALGAIYFLLRQIIVASSFLPNQLTAIYLAQEGIEVVRNIRDTNWIEGEDWKNGLQGYSSDEEGCEINDGAQLSYNSQSLEAYDKDTPLYIYNGFYTQTPLGEKTSFKRRIVINSKTDSDGNEYLEVICYVCWKERGRTHQVKLIENLYGWY